MGDRTSVTLTFPTVLLSEVESIDEHEPVDRCEYDDLTIFQYHDINYGDLLFLDTLCERGIPFESCWDSGSEFGSGTEYCRYSPEGIIQRINIDDSQINPDMNRLMQLIDNPISLKEYILQHLKDTTPLPWDDQVKYGKIFRTRQLIHA